MQFSKFIFLKKGKFRKALNVYLFEKNPLVSLEKGIILRGKYKKIDLEKLKKIIHIKKFHNFFRNLGNRHF